MKSHATSSSLAAILITAASSFLALPVPWAAGAPALAAAPTTPLAAIHAQDPPPPPDTVIALEEIVVTARNRAEPVSGGINDLMAFGNFGNALLTGCTAVRINPDFPARGPPSFPPPGNGTGGADGCCGPGSFVGDYLTEGTFPAHADLVSWGGSAELTWILGDWGTLGSLTGHRGMRLEASRDADSTPANILATQELLDHAQLSEELQLGGLAGGGRVHWRTGLYLFREYGYQRSDVIVPPGALTSGGDYEHSSIAGFAQVTDDVSDRLSLTVGGRYTMDRKGLRPDNYAQGDASRGAGSIFAPTWPLLAGVYSSPSGAMRPGDRQLRVTTSAAYIAPVYGRPRELSVAVEYSW